MTPEELAQRFHEAYRRVSPRFYGTTATAPGWDEIPDKSREHLIAVCRDVLGEETDEVRAENPKGEEVPDRETFKRAREEAEEREQGEDALSDWEKDLNEQIERAARRAKGLASSPRTQTGPERDGFKLP